MSNPAAPPAVRCAVRTCATPPTARTVGRCAYCREELPQLVCREHEAALTTAMLLLNVRSQCHRAPVTLVRIEVLP